MTFKSGPMHIFIHLFELEGYSGERVSVFIMSVFHLQIRFEESEVCCVLLPLLKIVSFELEYSFIEWYIWDVMVYAMIL